MRWNRLLALTLLLWAMVSGAVIAAEAPSDSSKIAPPASNEKLAQILMRARSDYQLRHLNELNQAAEKLEAEHYLLAGYARYWQLLLTLNDAQDSHFEAFLKQYPDLPFSDKISAEWLKQLAKRQQWDKFFAVFQGYSKEDIGVQCAALLGRNALDDRLALIQGREIWHELYDWPSGCQMLFDEMQKEQILSQEDLWKKLRNSLRDQQLETAKLVLARLPNSTAAQGKRLDALNQNPQLILKHTGALNSRVERELAIYALARMAKRDWAQTQKVLSKIQPSLTPEEKNYLAVRLATAAAFNLQDDALKLFEQIDSQQEGAKLDEQAYAWKARAALRLRQWDSLQATIREMPAKLQLEPVWRYWLARCHKEKREIANANSIFVELAKQRNFYGVLAEEEMGDVMRAPSQPYIPSSAELEAIGNLPTIQRAVELENIGLRWESRAEWSYAIKNMSDKQLISAAEYANKLGWLDVAINTIEKTQQLNNDTLRYPLPYREVVENFANHHQVDSAWVYGLSRQESRFNLNARSGVGASGMMQVMPATAKWIAKRNGWKDFKTEHMQQLDTNIKLGTYYLRYTLDSFAGQTPLATAAYNAGPSRVRNWVGDQSMEGAIYAETIPILETRLYVQKVMLNTYYYTQRLGKPGISLKQLLGKVSNGSEWQNKTNPVEEIIN